MSEEKRQQEAQNSLSRTSQCLCAMRDFVVNAFVKTDEIDGSKSECRCFALCCRRSTARVLEERVVYPRLELPEHDLQFEYDMSHKSRGVAMIFNHEKFLNPRLSPRTGTTLDRDLLTKVLEAFSFEVKVHNDLSLDGITHELNKVSSMDHKQKDCLLVVVLTHGEEKNLLHAFDRSYSLEHILSSFTDESCPSLKGKPRLFFIQACRGDKFDSGQLMFGDWPRHSLNRPPVSDELDTNPFQRIAVYEEAEDLFFSPPVIHQDFLVVRSTMSKHFSFRNPAQGSWFIQALCEELEANGESDDILCLLTHVNWKISERESSGSSWSKGKKQTTCISSMLTKVLTFHKRDSESTNL